MSKYYYFYLEITIIGTSFKHNSYESADSTDDECPIGESNMEKSSGHESKYISVLYSQLYNFVLYIQLFKENVTFKLHFDFIVLPCKQQNVTNIRFLNYMHLPLKRTSSYKNTHTHS